MLCVVRLTLMLVPCGLASLFCATAAAQLVSQPSRPPLMLPPAESELVNLGSALGSGFDAFAESRAHPSPADLLNSLTIPFGATSIAEPQTALLQGKSTIRRYRESFLQRLRLYGGWIRKGSGDQLGISYWTTSASFAIPLGSADNLILATPTFDAQYLDGPMFIDVPPRLYFAGADLIWRIKWNDNWATIVGARPGIYSDFTTSRSAFRTSGLAVVQWSPFPEHLSFVAGVAYLDRNDFDFLPALGMNWFPTPDHRFELIFPRPKIAYRVGHLPMYSEDWVYVRGNIGGGSWSVTRASGAFDELTLRDYRVSLGLERILDGGSNIFGEVGWVFGRRLEYLSSPAVFAFENTLVIEAGVAY